MSLRSMSICAPGRTSSIFDTQSPQKSNDERILSDPSVLLDTISPLKPDTQRSYSEPPAAPKKTMKRKYETENIPTFDLGSPAVKKVQHVASGTAAKKQKEEKISDDEVIMSLFVENLYEDPEMNKEEVCKAIALVNNKSAFDNPFTKSGMSKFETACKKAEKSLGVIIAVDDFDDKIKLEFRQSCSPSKNAISIVHMGSFVYEILDTLDFFNHDLRKIPIENDVAPFSYKGDKVCGLLSEKPMFFVTFDLKDFKGLSKKSEICRKIVQILMKQPNSFFKDFEYDLKDETQVFDQNGNSVSYRKSSPCYFGKDGAIVIPLDRSASLGNRKTTQESVSQEKEEGELSQESVSQEKEEGELSQKSVSQEKEEGELSQESEGMVLDPSVYAYGHNLQTLPIDYN